MTALTTERREEFAKEWAALDAREAEIEAARAPIEAQLRPFIEQSIEVEAEREALTKQYGAEYCGKCEHCGKPLFFGDQGSRPYEDETGIIFCAEHGMTYGDLKESWEHVPAEEDDEDHAESRKHALAMVESHLAAGGALTDLTPPYEL